MRKAEKRPKIFVSYKGKKRSEQKRERKERLERGEITSPSLINAPTTQGKEGAHLDEET